MKLFYLYATLYSVSLQNLSMCMLIFISASIHAYHCAHTKQCITISHAYQCHSKWKFLSYYSAKFTGKNGNVSVDKQHSLNMPLKISPKNCSVKLRTESFFQYSLGRTYGRLHDFRDANKRAFVSFVLSFFFLSFFLERNSSGFGLATE